MTLSKNLIYLASPYAKYTTGADQAHIDVCAIAGHLIKAGLNIYSPIAHCHPIAIHSGMALHNYELWMPLDKIMMGVCDNLLVAHMPGWQESRGIAEEVEFFEQAGKPIFDLDIRTLCITQRANPKKPTNFDQISFDRI